jgi:hypothetical protein
VCIAVASSDEAVSMETIQARLDLDRGAVQPDAVTSIAEQAERPPADAMAWLAYEPFAIAIQ